MISLISGASDLKDLILKIFFPLVIFDNFFQILIFLYLNFAFSVNDFVFILVFYSQNKILGIKIIHIKTIFCDRPTNFDNMKIENDGFNIIQIKPNFVIYILLTISLY